MKFRNPETGGVGDIEASRVNEALSRGMEPLQDLEMYNPETRGKGLVPAAQAAEAAKRGLLPVGSHEHLVATTGKLESLGRGAAQGATFGFADEIMGALKSAFGDQTYSQARDEYRNNDAIAAEANPITNTLGNVGGSMATALIPGLGVAKGATLGQEIGLGAKLGALSAAGGSRADLTQCDVGGFVKDVGTGGVFGAGAGAVVGGLSRAFSKAGGAVRDVAEQGLNPETNRQAVLGFGKGDMKKLGIEGADEVTDELAKHGVFDANSREKIFENIENLRTNTADQIRSKVTGQAYAPIDTWASDLRGKFGEIVMKAPPAERDALANKAQELLSEVYDTGGSVANAWDLKKNAGNWVNDWFKAPSDQPSTMRLYQELYGYLGKAIENTVDNVATQTGDKSLAMLNKTYSATATVQDTLRRKLEADVLSGRVGGGLNVSDYLKGNVVGAAVQNMTGIPGIGTVSGVASALGASALRSPAGRLARAKIGEAMGLGMAGARMKAERDAAAQAAGAIPRTLQGVRDFIQKAGQMIPPQFAQSAQRIMRLPDSAAEVEIRMLMPMLANMMTPSTYDSEFNGKISSPQDRIAATQIIKAQGLPPSVASYHLSMLNKGGTLQPYHYAKPAEDYGDELLQFNDRLTQMGY